MMTNRPEPIPNTGAPAVFQVRPMTLADVEAADRLRAAAGWNQTLKDWQRLFTLAPDGCFVAEQAGEIIATGTTTSYGRTLAWIGMMLVHPACRGRGIGRAVLERCISRLRLAGVGCIKLDATPQGKVLYDRVGFISEWTLTRWERRGGTGAVVGEFEQIRRFEADDWPAVLALDRQTFGVNREALLRALAGDSERVLVASGEGRIVGFGMFRGGARANYLGPVIARPDLGEALVATLLSDQEEKPVFWDVPEPNDAAVKCALRFGFVPLRPLTRMVLGANSVPSLATNQWALADPSTG